MELQQTIPTHLANSEKDIFDLALQLATHAHPQLDVDRYQYLMEDWAESLQATIEPEDETVTKVARLNKFFFADLGFNSNADDFYDPGNSMLNQVIEQRSGIPISLSILFIKLGQMIGLDIHGLSFPGHFLVKINVDGNGILVLDTYHGGVSLDETQLLRLLKHAQPEATEALLVEYLKAASKKEVVMRLARNLKGIYMNMKNYESALNILNVMLAVDNTLVNERRDRGLALNSLQCKNSALADLEYYINAEPGAVDHEIIRKLVLEIRSEAAPLH